MLPFYILIFIPLLIQHTKVRGIEYQKKNKFALKVFFAILLMLLMFRAEHIGNDTSNYTDIFKSIGWHGPSGVDIFADEPGFVIYTWLVSLLTDNAQIYIAISAIIYIILIGFAYFRLCEDATLTIALFCFISTFPLMFSGIRQTLAIGIGFIVYYFVKKKKIIYTIITIIIAVSIHTSAIILCLMYPLYHAKITKKWLWVVVPILFVIFAFNQQIFSVLSAYVNEYTRFDSTIEETGAYTMIIVFAVLGVFSFLIPDENKLDEETIGLRNLLLLAIVIQLFAPLHTLAMRMGYYFIIFIPLLIPKIIKLRLYKWNQIAIYSRHIMIILCTMYFLYSMHYIHPLHISPYDFFWEVM